MVVGFDSLPAAAAVAALPQPQIIVNRLRLQREPGRKAVDQGQQGLAVRFARGPVTQHGRGL